MFDHNFVLIVMYRYFVLPTLLPTLLCLTTLIDHVHLASSSTISEIEIDRDLHRSILKREILPTTRLIKSISKVESKVDPKSDFDPNLPVNDKLSSVFYLNDSHEHLLIKWVGGNSSVMICLAKYRSQRYMNKSADQVRSLTSNLYISYDYGTTFVKIDKLKLHDTDREPLINNFYISELLKSHFIFTDIVHNHMFVTQDFGRNFVTVKTPFSPKVVQLHGTLSQFVLASDENGPEGEPLYFSNDFGSHWDPITNNVKRFFWDNWNGFRARIFVQKHRANGHFDLVSSDDFFRRDEQIWLSNINEFRIANQYILITRNASLLSSSAKEAQLELWVSYNRNPPQKAIFDQLKRSVRVVDFFLADSSEDELFLAVRFNDSSTDLYISNLNGNQFQLSLRNIVTGNGSQATSSSSSSGGGFIANKISTVDIHKVAGLKGIYIANVYLDGANRNQFGNIRSVISFNKGATWKPLTAPDRNYKNEAYRCQNNCSLYLIQNDMPSPFKYQPIMSKESAVGTVLAAGLVQGQHSNASNSTAPNLFVSRDGGLNWREVFDGRHIFNMGDFGGVIVAVKHYSKSNITDRLQYSLDEGETWSTLRFINQSIKVYSVLIENGEKTSKFTIFGSLNADKHRWVLVKVDLSPLIEKTCDNEGDYEFWSPHRPESGCLMGRREMFFRRKLGAHCLNGEDFDKKRLKIIENCNCTRDDYECDFGYRTYSGADLCLPDTFINMSMPEIDCEPEKMVTLSQGYRKVQGNTCVDTEPSVYGPITEKCPAKSVAENNERSVFKAIFLSLFCTTLIFMGVFGAMFFLRNKRTQSNLFFLTNTHYNTRSDSAILLDADELGNVK